MAGFGLGLMASAAMTWISGTIVMGLTAYFVRTTLAYSDYDGGRHIVYTLVAGALTTLVYPVVTFLSRGDTGRRGTLMPINLTFSYLWLAAFVVNTDDWAANQCQVTFPFVGADNRGDQLCAHKHAVMSFSFLAFFFSAVSTAIEGFFARRGDTAFTEKRSSRDATGTTV